MKFIQILSATMCLLFFSGCSSISFQSITTNQKIGCLIPVVLIVGWLLLAAILKLKHDQKVDKDLRSGNRNIFHWRFQPEEWRQMLNAIGNRDSEAMSPPEVIIGREGILMGNKTYVFSEDSVKLVFEPGNPSVLHFDSRWIGHTKAGIKVTTKTARHTVPVPKEQEPFIEEIKSAFFQARFTR